MLVLPENFMNIIKRIPRPLYKKIYSLVPLPCVEAVVMDGRGNFLLIKRISPPMAGQWWFPGGRMYKFEPSQKAVLRSLKQEAGISGEVIKLMGIHEGIFQKGHFPGISCHTPTLVH
jgi:ADP-ribose pyrophosphatase YjhB (NUDIX family)